MEEKISEIQSIETPAKPTLSPEPGKGKSWSKTVLILVFSLALVGGLIFAGYKFKGRQTQPTSQPKPSVTIAPTLVATPTLRSTPASDSTADWSIYTNEEYGFEIKHPNEWILESDTRVFKEGDLFSIKIIGETQKIQTEFYDGAGLTIGVPVKTDKDIKTWVKDYYPAKNVNDEPNEFSEETVGPLTFQKFYTCGLGCFTYYNVKKNDNVYRLMAFAAGPDQARYRQTLLQALSTFKFLSSMDSTGSPKAESGQEEYCIKAETGEKMGLSEAKEIALSSECVKEGSLKEEHFCNESTGTWWIDLDIQKQGCAPACVINVSTKKAEINWRCTGGLIPQ